MKSALRSIAVLLALFVLSFLLGVLGGAVRMFVESQQQRQVIEPDPRLPPVMWEN